MTHSRSDITAQLLTAQFVEKEKRAEELVALQDARTVRYHHVLRLDTAHEFNGRAH